MRIVFTKHAKERMIKRRIAEKELIERMKHPLVIIKKQGKHYIRTKLQRGPVEIVTERTKTHIKIITVYWI